jgi:exonuclease III
MRGTAIVARKEMANKVVHKLPSGRAMAIDYNGMRIVNIYAPMGTARRTKRERFFNNELPYTIHNAANHTILEGDFNYVLIPADTTGTINTSKALAETVRALSLVDTGRQDPLRPGYTHNSITGATRIYRIYVTKELAKRKTRAEIVPAAFTDHNAFMIRLTLEVLRRRPGRWKMTPTQQDAIKMKTREEWKQCKTQQ